MSRSEEGQTSGVMSGRPPLSRVSSRFCEHLGRGHVYGLFARAKNPLALMVDPLGSLPHHRNAFTYVTLTPVGLSNRFRCSHHLVGALDTLSPYGETPVCMQAFFKPRLHAVRICRRSSEPRK